MYKEKTVCVVIPCYNEETQIEKVITTMPEYVDYMVLVDDQSRDRTVEVIKKMQETNKQVILIEHKINQGVGNSYGVE